RERGDPRPPYAGCRHWRTSRPNRPLAKTRHGRRISRRLYRRRPTALGRSGTATPHTAYYPWRSVDGRTSAIGKDRLKAESWFLRPAGWFLKPATWFLKPATLFLEAETDFWNRQGNF